MENAKHLSLGMKSKFEVIEKVNDEFSRVKVYVCGVGKNRNMSYIGKDVIDNALPTLSYCPLVAHLYEDKDGKLVIGGHDAEFQVNEDGIYLKDLTVPFGVVIADTYNYETVTEYGKDVTYLTAEAFVWSGRYPDLMQTIYSDDVWFNESMEINPVQYRVLEEDSNYTEILDMTFSALCLLQKADDDSNVEPCFISSHVEPVKFSLDNDFSMAFSEMKEKLAFCLKDNPNKFQEGGNTLTKEVIDAIFAEFELAADAIDFEISEDMTEEDFRAKLDEFKKKKCEAEIPENAENQFALKFSATYGEKRDALRNALDPIYVRDKDENLISSTYFYVQDFDDTYVYVERDFYSDDSWEETNGRFAYTFDNEAKTATITSEFEQMILKWLTLDEAAKLEASHNAFEQMKSEFDLYKGDYSTPNSEVEELKTFKANVLAEQRTAEETELFSKFDEKLNEVEEYSALKENCKDMTLEAISDKCFALLGKKLAQFSYAPKPKSNIIKVPVANDNEPSATSPYGDLYDRYLKK